MQTREIGIGVIFAGQVFADRGRQIIVNEPKHGDTGFAPASYFGIPGNEIIPVRFDGLASLQGWVTEDEWDKRKQESVPPPGSSKRKGTDPYADAQTLCALQVA